MSHAFEAAFGTNTEERIEIGLEPAIRMTTDQRISRFRVGAPLRE